MTPKWGFERLEFYYFASNPGINETQYLEMRRTEGLALSSSDQSDPAFSPGDRVFWQERGLQFCAFPSMFGEKSICLFGIYKVQKARPLSLNTRGTWISAGLSWFTCLCTMRCLKSRLLADGPRSTGNLRVPAQQCLVRHHKSLPS